MTADPFIAAAALLWQRILQVEHADIFAGACDDIRDREHGYDRLPQPGFIGGSYKPGGVLLLGQNPGNDGVGKGMSAPDQLQYRLLQELRAAPDPVSTVTAFVLLMSVLGSHVMPGWKIIKNVVQPLLDGLDISLDQVAYTNMVKFRTDDSRFSNVLYERSWELTVEQIDLLSPEIIVVLGVGAYKGFAKQYRGQARVYRIARGIGDAFLPAAGRADIANICAAERH